MIDVSEAWARSEAQAAKTELAPWVPSAGFAPSPIDAHEQKDRLVSGPRTYTASKNDLDHDERVARVGPERTVR